MNFKIHYINRYNSQKRKVRENSGYEQVVKYSNKFIAVKGNRLISKLIFKFLKIEKPKNYLELTSSEELKMFFKAFVTGNPVFYLYADKDAFLLPLLKRKFGLKRIKLFGTLHWPLEISDDFSYYKHNLEDQFDGVIVLSSLLNPKPSKKRFVIPHGINLEFWKNDSSLKWENSYLILGISNRDHTGQIEIIRKIKQIDANAKFVLLMQDKTVYEQYAVFPEIKIINNRISDNDLKKLYAKSKAVILIQKYCLASNVVLECIGMNCPLLVNGVGDIEEYLGKEYPLYLDNPQEDDTLNRFCNDTNFRNEVISYLSEIGREFEWQAISEKTVDFIRNRCN